MKTAMLFRIQRSGGHSGGGRPIEFESRRAASGSPAKASSARR
jgi:hypothetical protein